MTDNTALDLTQVKAQWQESQRLLDEARVRLEALGSARQASERSATALEGSREALQALVAAHAQAVDALRAAQEIAVRTLESVTASAQATDASQVGETLEQLGSKQMSMEQQLAQVRDVALAVGQDVAGLKVLVDRSSELERQLERTIAERDQARSDVQKIIAGLPGRYASKAQSLLS